MARRAPFAITLSSLMLQGVMMGGCAESVPKAQQSRDIVRAYRLDADDQPTLLIATAPGILATNAERDHLARLLTERLGERRTHNVADGNARQCEVHVLVTRLDRSSNFTPALQAGLGQVHLDASVVVTPVGGGDPLNAFTISKTFAWRGIYGTPEGIKKFEPAFADGIAAALTGQPVETE